MLREKSDVQSLTWMTWKFNSLMRMELISPKKGLNFEDRETLGDNFGVRSQSL